MPARPGRAHAGCGSLSLPERRIGAPLPPEHTACLGHNPDELLAAARACGMTRELEISRVCASGCAAGREFVGHAGGGDFVVLFQIDDREQRCPGANERFGAGAVEIDGDVAHKGPADA